MADTPPAAGAEPVAEGTEQAPEPETMYGCPVVEVARQPVLFVERDRYIDVFREIRGDGFELLIDLAGVDYLAHPGRPLPAGTRPERFEVVVNVLDIVARRRLRVRCQVPDHDPR